MNTISNILYWISTGLLVPVIVLLIFFFIRAILLIGTFFGQYLQEKKTSDRLGAQIKALAPETVGELGAKLPAKSTSLMVDYARRLVEAEGNGPKSDLILSEYEIAADKNIATSKVLTKMGPILGLMGTLIPMGPALVGLASGDIASMAYNMQVAFATTVVGLTISAVGFLTQQAKERWAVRNLALLEFIAQTAKQGNAGNENRIVEPIKKTIAHETPQPATQE